MTIHRSHPFEEPPDQVRRFRGRLGGAVTLWTAAADPDVRSGLTVSSIMVGLGEEGRIFALLDPDADLSRDLEESGRAVVHLLGGEDVDLAEAFAGTAPAPGGPFRLRDWTVGAYGPELAHRPRARVRVESTRPAGWSLLVETVVEEIEVDPAQASSGDSGLEHRRGRYHRL